MKLRIFMKSDVILGIGLCLCGVLFVSCGSSDKKAASPAAAERMASKAEPAAADDPRFRGWLDFATETDGFQIFTPKSFDMSRDKQATEAGEIELTTYLAELLTATYGVTCNDFAEALVKGKDPEIIIRGGAKGFVSHLNGTVSSEKIISLGESKGVEFVLTGSSQGVPLFAKGRFYLVRNKMYQIYVVAEKGKEDLIAIDKFLDSFKVK